MNPPVVSAISEFTALQYRVTIVAPHSGGAGVSIEEYEISFKPKDSDTFVPVPGAAECDGSSGHIVTTPPADPSNLHCDVSLATLTASPFLLQRGDVVLAKVRARNVLDYGLLSSASDADGAALIVSVPITPISAPTRDEAACSETVITVNMPQISGTADTGGLSIETYQLQWATGASPSESSFVDLAVSSATFSEATGLTTGEAYSFRYLVRNEVGPSPAASPVLSTFAAVAPAKMSAPLTTIVGLDAAFSWTAPASTGGKPITGYKVYIRGKTGEYHLETDHCSVSTTSCSVSLLTLQGSPYFLEQGVRIQATVSAVNAVGESVASSVNSGGAFLETVPSAPPVAPSRNVLTGQTSITVDFLSLAGTSSGGAPVQSYELLWDKGVNHAETDLVVI